ncbi:MAG: DNA polymerase III subunit beta [Acidobacteriota bacterium]
MKFSVARAALHEELSLTQGVVESKSTIPILSHMLVRTDGDGLELLATDLEVGLRTRCAAEVEGQGAAAVPARKLHDVVRALDGDAVHLESKSNDWVAVKSGSFNGRVVGLPEGDFPAQPAFPEDGVTVKLPLSSFHQMLSRVIFAVTTENTRFSINGALLKITKDSVTLVATDGHRLAYVNRAYASPELEEEMSVLVPRKALQELLRFKVQDENEELELTAQDNHVFFRAGRRTLYARLLEGAFPRYERVLPDDNQVIAKVSREAFDAVITRVAVLTNDTARMVALGLSDGNLSVSTTNPNMGEASEDLPAEITGGEAKIGLNYEYIRQFLQAVPDEMIEIHLKDSSTQALFVPGGETELEHRYVIMPMRLS